MYGKAHGVALLSMCHTGGLQGCFIGSAAIDSSPLPTLSTATDTVTVGAPFSRHPRYRHAAVDSVVQRYRQRYRHPLSTVPRLSTSCRARVLSRRRAALVVGRDVGVLLCHAPNLGVEEAEDGLRP